MLITCPYTEVHCPINSAGRAHDSNIDQVFAHSWKIYSALILEGRQMTKCDSYFLIFSNIFYNGLIEI